MKEIRSYEATEIRAIGGTGDADPLALEGYAATFNTYSRDLGGFREKIKPGAFDRVISERQDVRCLFNHDPSNILGRTTASTLLLRQDAKGLWYRCILPNTQFARDLHASIERGDISQCSFSFTVNGKKGQSWGEDEDERGYAFPTRELIDVDCYDVSPVTYPAYENGTNVQARAEILAGIPKEILASVERRNAEHIMANENRGSMQNNAALAPVNPTWKPEVQDAFRAAFDASYKAATDEGKKRGLAWSLAMAAGYNAIKEMVADVDITPGTAVSDNSKTVDTTATQATLDVHRAAEIEAEKRKKSDEEDGDDPDGDDEGDDLSNLDSLFDEDDLEDRGEVDPTKLHENHVDGECAEPSCGCQNRFGFHKRSNRAFDPGQVADKINDHINRSNRHAFVAASEAERGNEEARAAHQGAAEKHMLAASAHAGLEGESKEVAEAKSTEAAGASDEAVRCSMRCSEAAMNAAKRSADNACADVIAAHRGHMAMNSPSDASQKGLEDSHAAHAVEARKFTKVSGDEMQQRCNMRGLGTQFPENQAIGEPMPMRSAPLTKEVRGVTTRTKRVDGKDVPASGFAHVGDPDRTETWNCPIHDAKHAELALQMSGQVKGLSEGERKAMDSKIAAAAKKFGVGSDDKEQNSFDADAERRSMLASYLEAMGPDAVIPDILKL